jgi:hypothetical protein
MDALEKYSLIVVLISTIIYYMNYYKNLKYLIECQHLIIHRLQLGQTGVDEQSAYLFRYEQGQLALLASAVRTETASEATVLGTKGRIRLRGPIYCPTRLTLTLNGQDEVIDAPLVGNGYNYETVEVMNCLRADQMESQTMPLDETLQVMKTMDQIRAQWGLKYPME